MTVQDGRTDVLLVAAAAPDLVGFRPYLGEGLAGAVRGLAVTSKVVGFGPGASASATARGLAAVTPRALLLVGTCGVYPGLAQYQPHDVVVTPRVVALDHAVVQGASEWPTPMATTMDASAAIVAGLTTDVSVITILAIVLIVGTFYVLWRTSFGLRLRSCGEAPYAAATLGVNVIRYKYIAVITSGALAGVGGAYLAIVAAGIYREGQTGGRGYIGLAAMIFGNWRPGGLAAGAGLFGYTDALQLRGGGAVHALLLLIALLLIAYAAWLLYRRRWVGAVVGLVIAGLMIVWWATTDDVPPQVAFVTPYVATLLVLALATQRLRMPAADGKPYLKGEEH